MFNFKNLFFILLFSTIFTGFVVAQPPPTNSSKNSSSSNNTQNKENFVSLDGGFTIALPQQVNGFTGVKPIEGRVTGGSQFNWQMPQGVFTAGYTDRIQSANSAKEILQVAGDYLVGEITNNRGGKLLNRKEISLDGNPGIEVKMQLKENATSIVRYYLVKNRMFTLTVAWFNTEPDTTPLRILDSFKLIDGKAILAQKIEEVTPKSLPQLPIVKKSKTDAEDEGLKGKVKSVVETKEDLTGTSAVSGIRMSSEDFYDENGNQVKQIYYDYRGNPSSVTVYGFIDGFRVSKYGESVRYEYNPPAPIAPPPSATMPPSAEKTKPVDTRYSVRFEYKYDDKGRLQETVRYRNNGAMTGKTVYIYDGNKLDETSYDKEGKITFKTIELFDDKGNTIEKTFVRQDSKYPDSRYTYKYESFDEKGNWTKRTVTGKEGLFNGGFKDQNYIEYRTITYYQ